MTPLSVVTGVGVHGIGLEVVAGLRSAGHHVIMGCRSHERCNAAKELLDARGLPGSCECRPLDLNDFASIKRFATDVEGPLSVHINNAGVMGVAAEHGTCAHWRPNALGPYLLTRLLLPHMAARGRIVTVASEAHRRGSLQISSDGEQQQRRLATDGGGWYAQYARSKLANVLMTAELSRRLQKRGSTVTCSSVSPGRVNTGIYSNVPGWLQTPLRWLAAAAFQTPAQGASTVVYAALSPELGRHELYLHAMRPCRASPAAYDAKLAGKLWQLSNEQVGLTAAEDAALWPPH